MKGLNELELQGLHWKQKGWLWRESQLLTGDDEVVATLRRPRWWSRAVEVDGIGMRWQMERRGFWRQRIEITSLGTGESPARFDYRWTMTGGTLTFANGTSYVWKQGNLWGTKWVWTDAQGTPVMGFQTGGVFRLGSDVHLDPNSPAQTLLVFLGWYLILLHTEDVAASAAASGH